MATVLVSNLAHISDLEAGFFHGFIEALCERGHRVVLWSAVPKALLRDHLLPMSWRIADWEDLYHVGDVDLAKIGDGLDLDKWRIRINLLGKQGARPFPPDRSLELVVGASHQLIEQLRPDLFLAWNNLCPHTGIAYDLCKAAGIPALLIERAYLPDTWFIEDGGLLGHSKLAGTSLDELVSADDRARLSSLGSEYLAGDPFETLARYTQSADFETQRRLVSGDLSRRKPRVAFFPPDDLSLGFFPTDHEDRRRHLPHFPHSFEAADVLARTNEAGVTIFKPHPSFLEWRFEDESSPLVVLNHDYRALIDWADCVATTGSGLAFAALAQGKPVLHMGRDQLVGKGIVYEATTPDAIPGALEAALEGRDLDERMERFQTFVGYSLSHYVVSHPDTPASRRHPERVAAELHDRYLRERPTADLERGARELRASLLRGSAEPSQDEDPGPASESWYLSACTSEAEIDRELENITQELNEKPDVEVVLDFDYTLLLSNSTELYLSHVFPAWMGYLLDRVIRRIRPWRFVPGAGNQNVALDGFRVLLATLLFPWTYFVWRAKAPELARRYANRRLIESLKAAGRDEAVVISNGFYLVIRPMLPHLGLRARRLVASDLAPWRRNPRKSGKAVALAETMPELRTDRVLFVTDSDDDRDLLEDSGLPHWITWPCDVLKAHQLTYLPFRYTADAKYKGKNVVRRHRLGEDLPVLLLAYQALLGGLGATPFVTDSFAWSLWTLLTLFVSFHCVYEIGYHDNDFRASHGEQNPNVPQASAPFEHYPIRRMGWIWGLGFAFLAFLPSLFSPTAAGAADSWLLGSLREALGTQSGLAAYTAGLALWLPVLVATRGFFRFHNRLPVRLRTYSFAALQIAKLGAFAPILQLTLLGSALMTAQVLRHLSNYILYRHGGRTDSFLRQLHRLQMFLVMAALLWLTNPGWVPLDTPQLWLILTWCGFTAATERYAPRFGFRRTAVLRGLYSDTRRVWRRFA